MKVGPVLFVFVLCSLVLFSQAMIFPLSGKSLQETPRGQIPVIQHVPNFAQNVLISISFGDTTANVRSILVDNMTVVSYCNISDIESDAFPIIDEIASIGAIILSGISKDARSFTINPQTGVLTQIDHFSFPGTPISLGADLYGSNDNQIIMYTNSTLYFVSLSSTGIFMVETGVNFPNRLNNSEYVVAGFNAASQGIIILQISTSASYFAFYNSSSGILIRVSDVLYGEQRFVPVKGLSGYMFRNSRTSFDTGHYDITPFDLLNGQSMGAKYPVPRLLFGSNIIVERLSTLMFTVSYNHTNTYLTQIFIGNEQVQGVSLMRDNAALVTSIGSNDNYVFSIKEQQSVPNTRPVYTLFRYDYNGSH